jgi:FMN-dependent NADH-azoreductase
MDILFINACVRTESRTHKLAEKVLQKLNGRVTEINLENENIVPHTQKSLIERSKLIEQERYDDVVFKYAKQFAQAEIIVIAAPFWDMSFPALLKCYIEAINVVGITFKYTSHGVESLCKAKKLFYVTSAGGTIMDDSFGFGYIKSLANILYGISNVQMFKAEGLDIIGADKEAIMQKALDNIDAML